MRTTQPDNTYSVTMYDGLGRVTKQMQHASGGTAFAVSQMLYDDGLNVVTKAYQYADPASQSDFNATTDPAQAQLYHANGRLTATVDAHGHATSYVYDDLGRQVETTDAKNNKQIVIYDDADRTLTQLQLDYDGTNHVTFTTAMAYDGLNRVTATTNVELTQTSSKFYDALGRVTLTQDPAGQKVASLFDGLDNVTRVTEDVDTLARHTDRSYDRAGRLTQLTGYTQSGGGDQETVYAYNKAGVMTRATYPDDNSGGGDRGYVVQTFDVLGRVTRTNHQDNTNTDVVYDDMGRRLTVTRGTEVDSFGYTDAGQLASAERGTSGNPDAVSKVERSYDALQRVTRESQTIREGTARNVDYAYDLGSSVLTRTYPDGTTLSYSYTDIDQVDTIQRDTGGGAATIAEYTYTGNRPTELEMPTGTAHAVVQSHQYDAGGRLTRLGQSRNSTALATFSYNFDDANNITKRTFEHRSGTPAPSEVYAHDSLNRLTRTDFGQRSGDPYEGFVYDLLGNHLTQDHDGTEFAGLFNDVNEQTKRDGSDVTWDLRGNLTEDDPGSGGQEYFYDGSNLLTRVEDGSSNRIASYAYDALGRRIEKDVEDASGDIVTHFYYDGQRMVEERDATSGGVQRQYAWGGLYIDELILFRDVSGGDDDYLPLRHHNFNIVALVDRGTGSVVERYDYNPYGQRFVLDDDYSDDADGRSDVGLDIGHQGLMHDEVTGLIYQRARIWNPPLGRFNQPDPLGYPDGMNRYAGYHIMHGTLDPLGLWEIERDGGARAAAVTTDPDGETIRELAQEIGLDPSEYEAWLVDHYGGPLPGLDERVLSPRACHRFDVPNTIIVTIGDDSPYYRFGVVPLPVSGTLHRRANSYERTRQGEGFKVVRNNEATRTDITELLAGADVHGWFFAGHGSEGFLIDSTAEDGVDSFTISRSINHRLAEVILYACEAGWDDRWLDVRSENGTLRAMPWSFKPFFWGWDDIYVMPDDGWEDHEKHKSGIDKKK
jgi:RHS repeat-associated protein